MKNLALPAAPLDGAVIVPFPAKNRVGKIRRVAEVLGGRHGKSADRYWQQTVEGMTSQMERAGLERPVIERELRDFFNAVQAELCRAHYQGGGDAA